MCSNKNPKTENADAGNMIWFFSFTVDKVAQKSKLFSYLV